MHLYYEYKLVHVTAVYHVCYTGLSTRVADMRLHVRVKALNTLNAVLRKYGSLFSPQTWSVIFKGGIIEGLDCLCTHIHVPSLLFSFYH